MTNHTPLLTSPPRAHGRVEIAAKAIGPGRSGLAHLHQAGSAKLLPVPGRGAVEAVIINTSGGVTGGDTLRIRGTAQPGAHLRLTTQAAERIYCSSDQSPGHVSTTLEIAPGGRIDWLPQETIFFDQAHLRRRLKVNITGDGRALLVEPVLFGRLAMGETVQAGCFNDRIDIERDGTPIFADATLLSGDIAATLDHPAVGQGARAMALIVFVAPDAEAHLPALRALLPETAGASLVEDGLLVLRCLAADGFVLRQTLLPVLDRLSGHALPRPWRL